MITDAVIAVVVAYHPKAGEIEACVKSLLMNFRQVVVVWNGPHSLKMPTFLKDKCIHLLNMNGNVGLARALNEGIGKAFQLEAAWVYLSDQDSILPIDFKRQAIKYCRSIPVSYKVGSIGPAYFNEITGKEGSIIQAQLLKFKRERPNTNKFYIETDYLITSGSFISKKVFNDVGYFLDKLFIDLVDAEWGLRAKHKGYRNIVLPRLMLHHNLGEYGFSIFGVTYQIHSPLRIYYYFRNSIYLYKQKYISLNWKVIDCSRNILRFLFYIVLIQPRSKYLKMGALGIYHGIMNRMGELKL